MGSLFSHLGIRLDPFVLCLPQLHVVCLVLSVIVMYLFPHFSFFTISDLFAPIHAVLVHVPHASEETCSPTGLGCLGMSFC